MGISNIVEVVLSTIFIPELGTGNWLLSVLCLVVSLVDEGSILVENSWLWSQVNGASGNVSNVPSLTPTNERYWTCCFLSYWWLWIRNSRENVNSNHSTRYRFWKIWRLSLTSLMFCPIHRSHQNRSNGNILRSASNELCKCLGNSVRSLFIA